MSEKIPEVSVAQRLAKHIAALSASGLPDAVRNKCVELLIDVGGLCIAARNEDYIASAHAGWDDEGPCTAIGHVRTVTPAGAAFINGTAAHGEDFDDTFEGGPVHAGAVVIPAVLAACERYNLDGPAALLGIAIGAEVLCRLSLVIPKAVHKAGFHPTAVFGAMGAAAGVGATLGLNARQIVDALGIAGSMASGIIEYLAEGPGPNGCIQAGQRNRACARRCWQEADFSGRDRFEGVHGPVPWLRPHSQGNYTRHRRFRNTWVIETLAF